MSGINLINLAVGLVALVAGLSMLGITFSRYRRDDPRGVAMLIAGTMVAAFGLFITIYAVAFATSEPVSAGAAR